jgi:hypothetical protein
MMDLRPLARLALAVDPGVEFCSAKLQKHNRKSGCAPELRQLLLDTESGRKN